MLDAIMRRTLLLRMGYHESLTCIQLWLLNSLMQQTVFDIWDLILSEIEDTLTEGFRGHRVATICSLDYISDSQGSYSEAS